MAPRDLFSTRLCTVRVSFSIRLLYTYAPTRTELTMTGHENFSPLAGWPVGFPERIGETFGTTHPPNIHRIIKPSGKLESIPLNKSSSLSCHSFFWGSESASVFQQHDSWNVQLFMLLWNQNRTVFHYYSHHRFYGIRHRTIVSTLEKR